MVGWLSFAPPRLKKNTQTNPRTHHHSALKRSHKLIHAHATKKNTQITPRTHTHTRPSCVPHNAQYYATPDSRHQIHDTRFTTILSPIFPMHSFPMHSFSMHSFPTHSFPTCSFVHCLILRRATIVPNHKIPGIIRHWHAICYTPSPLILFTSRDYLCLAFLCLAFLCLK